VASDTAAHHLAMIEVHLGPEGKSVVAGCAVIAAGDVIGDFRRCVKGRPGGVAGAAIARRTLEDRVDMTGLARQVAVHTIELETQSTSDRN